MPARVRVDLAARSMVPLLVAVLTMKALAPACTSRVWPAKGAPVIWFNVVLTTLKVEFPGGGEGQVAVVDGERVARSGAPVFHEDATETGREVATVGDRPAGVVVDGSVVGERCRRRQRDRAGVGHGAQ